MRRLSAPVLATCLFLTATPVAAQEDAIESTIRDQIAAFLADDFATAFTFASPNIRAIFGNPENFGRMVTNGYPMVHRPAEVEMGPLREVAGALWQRVEITDAEGQSHALDYQMVEMPDGAWRINAVQLLRAEAPSV